MASTEWVIKGSEFANCNCSYGCPCQFNAPPTHGNCRAAGAWEIDVGHFGGVRLDGLRGAALYAFPGAVHEGNGTMQLIIDERADAQQRDALLKIMSGEETEEMATMWWVYSAMAPNKLEPLFKPISFGVDIEARQRLKLVPAATRLYLTVNHAVPDRQTVPTRFLAPGRSAPAPSSAPLWKRVLRHLPFF